MNGIFNYLMSVPPVLTPYFLQIDSIKWYKDGGEFYRVHPRLEGREDVRQFSVSGVVVDTNNTGLAHTGTDSWQHSVNILNTKLATSGSFRCQITEANAPFHTEQQDKNITVISKLAAREGKASRTNGKMIRNFVVGRGLVGQYCEGFPQNLIPSLTFRGHHIN